MSSGEQDETGIKNKSWGDVLKSAKAGPKPRLGEKTSVFFEVQRENSLVNI